MRGAKDSDSFSRSSINFLTRAILNMAEVPLFQYGWIPIRLPQLGQYGSAIDKLSVFSVSRYAARFGFSSRAMLLLPTARARPNCAWLPPNGSDC